MAMATLKETEKMKKFDEKYKFFSCNLDSGYNHGTYKNWDITFLLLTKEEEKKLVKQTFQRMKMYNKDYSPKGYAGYCDNSGDKI